MPVTILLKALGYNPEQILAQFFAFDTFHVTRKGIEFEVVPERLRGEIARFDIVEQGRQGDRAEGQAHHREAHPRHGSRGHEEALGGARLPRRPHAREEPRQQGDRRGRRQRERGDHRGGAEEDPRRRRRGGEDHLHQRPRPGPVHLADPARGRVHGRAERPGRDLPHDAPRRAADRRRREDPLQRPLLQRGPLRPLRRRPHEVQPPRGPRRADRRDDALPRGHRRGDQDPGRAAQRPRRDRRHRPPRQPPRALGGRAGREPVPLGPGARGARGARAPLAGREREPDAARPDQREARLRGDQGVLRLLAALAVHGPDQPALGDHAQAAHLRARPGRPHARARRLRGARRAPDALRPRLPDRDAGRPEHRPHQLARPLRAHQRVRLHRDAVPPREGRQGHQGHRVPVGDRGRQVRDRAGQRRPRQERQVRRRAGVAAATGTSSRSPRPTRSSTSTWRPRRSCRWPPR